MDSKKILKIALLALVLAGGLLLYYFYNPSQNSLFLPCPFKLVSGYNCPGCGSQRAIHQLLHGNFIAAFRLNPLMVLSLPLIAYGLATKFYNFVFETSYRVKIFYSNLFIYSYFTLAVIYWVLRNLAFYPFAR